MSENIQQPSISVHQDLKKGYDSQYEAHDGEWRKLGAQYKVQNIIDVSKNYTFNSVLEVGSGDGSILAALNDLDFCNELSGVDISKSGIARLNDRKLSKLKYAEIFDGYHIPFEDKSFDLVILSHVLEHVEHERMLLREIKRVSKYQVIEVPIDYRYNVDKRLQHFLDYGHINMYTPTALRYLLRTENFNIIDDKHTIIQPKVWDFINQQKPSSIKMKSKIEFLIRNSLFQFGGKKSKERFSQAYTVFCS